MVKHTSDKKEYARRKRQSSRDRERHENSRSYTRSTFVWLSPTPARPPSRSPSPVQSPSRSTVPNYEVQLASSLGDGEDTMVTAEEKASAGTLRDKKFAGMFNNPRHSDVTIYVGPQETILHGHGVILSIASPFFDAALESQLREGKTRVFHFSNDSAHALWRVFTYIYTATYSEEAADSLKDEGDDIELLKHPRVYALADMFLMEDLKSLSAQKFKTQLQKHWISDTFADCIREVYKTTSDNNCAMRKAVAQVALSNLSQLKPQTAFREAVREVGDFSVDLIDLFGQDRLAQ